MATQVKSASKKKSKVAARGTKCYHDNDLHDTAKSLAPDLTTDSVNDNAVDDKHTSKHSQHSVSLESDDNPKLESSNGSQEAHGSHYSMPPAADDIQSKSDVFYHGEKNQVQSTSSDRLYTQNLREVRRKVYSARMKWYDIGVELGMNAIHLDTIKSKHPNDPADYLTNMLVDYLKGSWPRPSWESLAYALKQDTVGHGQIADEIEREFLGKCNSSVGSDRAKHTPTLVPRNQPNAICDRTTFEFEDNFLSLTGSGQIGTCSLTTSPVLPSPAPSLIDRRESIETCRSNSSASQHMKHKTFQCLCRNCSLSKYMTQGCPEEGVESNQYPYLDTKYLSMPARKDLEAKLDSEVKKMVKSFADLSDSIIKSLELQGIAPIKIARCALSIGTYISLIDKPFSKKESVALEQAQSIDEIFIKIFRHMSFFNYELLQFIIEKLGTKSDCDVMKSYVTEFETFCKRSVFEVPPDIYLNVYGCELPEDSKLYAVKLEGNWKLTVGDVKTAQRRIAALLDVQPSTLLLCNVHEGCVKLEFSLPIQVFNQVLPLNQNQVCELQSYGITEAQCEVKPIRRGVESEKHCHSDTKVTWTLPPPIEPRTATAPYPLVNEYQDIVSDRKPNKARPGAKQSGIKKTSPIKSWIGCLCAVIAVTLLTLSILTVIIAFVPNTRLSAITRVNSQKFNDSETEPSVSPSNVTVIATNASTVLVSWIPPPPEDRNGIIQGYTVRVEGVHTDDDFTLSTNFTEVIVGGLHPFYAYRFTVATVTISHGPFGNPISLTMPPLAPSQPVSNITVEATSPTSLRLRWLPPSHDEWNGIIIRYTIEYNLLRQVLFDGDDDDDDEMEVGLPSEPLMRYIVYAPTNLEPLRNLPDPRAITDPLVWEEREINGLEEYYLYSISVYYENSAGRSASSDSVEINTPSAVPSGPPTSVSVSATSSRSITISWAPPQRDQQNGIILYYLVTVTSSSGSITRNVSSVQQTVSIAGLNPYTDYNCTVQAETIGVGPPSPVVQISTPEDVPTGPPTNVNAQAMSPTTFTLFWDQPVAEHRNGLILGYRIQVTELETGYMEQLNTTEETFVINERHPFYRYRYVVAAETIGLGPYSVASLIHMPEAAPSGSPVNVTITAVSSTGFFLSWDDPLMADRNGIVRNYIINVTEENTGNRIQLTSNTNSQRVESLHPFYNYSCVVSAVTVEGGPFSESIETTTSEDVPSGPPTHFSAMALSSCSVELTWDPPLIHERNGVITVYTITQVIAGNFSAYSTSDLMLEVMDLRPFSTYTFTITASTSIGEGPSTAGITAVTLENAPEGAPTNVATSNITSTSLTLTWLPPTNTLQNGVIRHYIILGLEVDTGTNFTYQAQSHTSFSIGDLHPYYTYQFNVFAVTVEVGPASLDHTVTTLQDVPTAPPGTIIASPMDSSTLLINWTPPPLESRNGLITEYVVNISAMETGDRFQHTAVGSNSSLAISMLHPDYTYTYTVAARTAIGQGPFSNSSSIRMPEDIPTLAPQNTTGRAVNSTSILFTWEHPLPSGRNGNITAYSLIVRELVTNTTTAYRQTGDHIDLVVGSLHPYYEYECIIAAETRVGRGPYGNPFIVRTLADVPSGVPLNVAGMAVTTRSIQLMWNPPETEEQNGVIQHYLVIVRVTQTDSSFSINSSTTSVTIPNLHPAYEYTIEVAAVTINVGPFSSALSITTPDDVPTGAPVAVVAVSISSTSIIISWQAPLLELQNGEITSYFITVLELETNTLINITTVATDSIYVINSLHPFYHYNCSVAAYTNGLGPSAYYVVQTQPGGAIVASSRSNTTLATTIVFVVLCAIFLIIIVVGVAAFIVWRRRRHYKTLRILTCHSRTTTAQVETTNFYEVPADVTTKTNPVAELEMNEPNYDVIPNHGASTSLDEDPPSDNKDNKTPKLAFRSEIPEEPPRYIDVSGAMKLDLAEGEEMKPAEADQELDHDDKISGEETKADLEEKDSEEDCDGDGELAYL